MRISANPRQTSRLFSSGTTSGTGCLSNVSGSAAAVVERHAATNWHAAARTAGASFPSSATRTPARGASGQALARSAHVARAAGHAARERSLHALARRCTALSRASLVSQNVAPMDAHARDHAAPGAASQTASKAAIPASTIAPPVAPVSPFFSSSMRRPAVDAVGGLASSGSTPMRAVQQ